MPAFVAAAPLLAKAVGFAKGLTGLGIAKGTGAAAVPAMSGFMKGAAARKFAGNAIMDYMGPGDSMAQKVAMNFGPDILFGGLAGAMTPGDIGDKLIAGTTTAAGGAIGGVGAVSLLGKNKNNPALRMMGEMTGGLSGDMVGQSVGNTLLSIKGGGMTPYEKEMDKSDRIYRAQIEEEIKRRYGIG